MKPELLSPVQDLVSLKAAIEAKADAVYFGAKELNMRFKAKNFELSEIKKVIELCHKNNVRAYFTLNAVVYDDEEGKVRKILKKLKRDGINAVIAWDFSVISGCEKLNIPIHLSTQASVSNFEAVKALKTRFRSIKRINLARELSLEQIKDIIKKIKKDKLGIEIEAFVHGAMCVSFSGRCFLSQEIFNKSANRGECLQPCRRRYIIKDAEEGHELELGEDYIISPKDLCTVDILDKLISAGIDAFKIEGRNRSPEYVKKVTECYREAIDNPGADKKRLKEKLRTVYNRGFSSGFYLGKPMNEWCKTYGSRAVKKKVYIGKVINYYKKIGVAEVLLETGDIRLNDEIIFQGNKTGVREQKVASIEVRDRKTGMAKKGQRAGIKTEDIVRENDRVFLVKTDPG
ncbi:U32 family peptidase [Candidatus Woesearchaeota archaeon]|nr:U32 family peptidase [Candidatus Woesearchaeota archaeon]